MNISLSLLWFHDVNDFEGFFWSLYTVNLSKVFSHTQTPMLSYNQTKLWPDAKIFRLQAFIKTILVDILLDPVQLQTWNYSILSNINDNTSVLSDCHLLYLYCINFL